MRLEDRARLALQVGQLGVVLRERLRLSADGVSPVGDPLQHVQKDSRPVHELGPLLREVVAGRLAGDEERLVLLVGLVEVSHIERQAAELIAPLQGLAVDVAELSLRRYEFNVQPLSDAVIADQQKIADTFFDLKLIPKAIAVRDASWKAAQ